MEESSWNRIPENLEGAALANALNRREFLRRSAYTAGIGLSLAASLSPGQVLAQAVRAQANPVPLGNANPIDHFVILMMENRSFDHYFGWLGDLYGDKVMASQHQTYKDPTGKDVETRHAMDVLGASPYQGCDFGDPGHGWDNGRAQLNGGFLAQGSGNDEFALSYYNQHELGFIHAAAAEYNIYDHYFCSLLGPTWPNRYYKWSAQSGGAKTNAAPVATAGNQWNTIFDTALAAGATATYYNSDLPFSAVWGARGAPWTRPIAEYYADCAAGRLSNVTIVDPPFRDGGGFNGNSADEHPMGDVRLGQAFMADVAHAFLESPHYRNGALFIIYDEWGGFFDHVRPPKVPDARAADDFGQMGFRTPTTVLSPFTYGTGIQNLGPLGHESILKLIEQRFNLSPLTLRDAQATSIGESFNWASTAFEPPADLPRPVHIVSKPCAAGGGDVTDDGSHANDMDGLEELAHRFGVPVGDGKPHQIFREPDSVRSALAASA